MEAHHLHLALSSLITLSFFLTILPPSYCTDNARTLCWVQHSLWLWKDQKHSVPFLWWESIWTLRFSRVQAYVPRQWIPNYQNWRTRVPCTKHQPISIYHDYCKIGPLEPCPPKFVNTTLDFNNFKYYTPTDQNLILFNGCPSGVSGLDGVNFSCSLDNNANYFINESFPGIHDLFKGCNTSIEVPILRTALIDKSVGLQNVLNQGFDVDYRNDRSITCSGCEASGGICGFNSSSHSFVYFCHDGEQPLVCSSNGMHARFSSIS